MYSITKKRRSFRGKGGGGREGGREREGGGERAVTVEIST